MYNGANGDEPTWANADEEHDVGAKTQMRMLEGDYADTICCGLLGQDAYNWSSSERDGRNTYHVMRLILNSRQLFEEVIADTISDIKKK